MFLSAKLNYIYYFYDMNKIESCELFDTTLSTEDCCEHFFGAPGNYLN